MRRARNTIPTPWPLINNLLGGGLGQGDLGLIAGGPGGGKSWALVALGAQAVKLGYTVVHYTLELSEKYVGRRYDACFTEIPVQDIVESKDKVKDTIENLRGGLYIREYLSRTSNSKYNTRPYRKMCPTKYRARFNHRGLRRPLNIQNKQRKKRQTRRYLHKSKRISNRTKITNLDSLPSE